ncbi:MAG: peptidoglycan-associated lipoprotein Pal [Proteobacteria bacterium]|nr:peptidoglycan-associated lipoprotein Pal [Pseudomonadota bacterium]
MTKKILIVSALLLVIPGLLLFASCGKKSIKADIGEVRDKLPGQKPASSGSASSMQEPASKPAPVIQSFKGPAGYAAEEIMAREKSEATQTFVNEDVRFDFDSAVLNNKAMEILKKKAAYLEKYSGVSAAIEGHCDERGTNEYNLALGERRAESTKEFLNNLGIAASRLKTISYGEEKPLDTGHDQEAWSKNRRAHFVIITSS